MWRIAATLRWNSGQEIMNSEQPTQPPAGKSRGRIAKIKRMANRKVMLMESYLDGKATQHDLVQYGVKDLSNEGIRKEIDILRARLAANQINPK